ncbi:MAG: ribosomal protein S18-alanine N-acetyltransferase [Candidatus Melainabacteria bacterium]|nr:ribosomal protein S18-alanine N-acetyltransferase [Candidatus Melainabacteria bacterium]
MDIKIRQMMLKDLDKVMEIEPIAFGCHHWSRQSFVNELNNPGGYYFVACSSDNGLLYGYSGFWLIGEEAHITTLAVHPDYRRKYVAERLLLNDIAQSQKVGAGWMTLEVRVSNEGAQNLYHKYGFKNLGLRRNYYQDNNEDAMVLWTENITSSEFQKLVCERVNMLAALKVNLAEV